MKQKAFTLMELLVVVIVVGVLAAVAVPKFSRVLETSRASEAESILNAVRTEQEARCVMGKKYLGENRRNDVVALSNTQADPNYEYELLAGSVAAKRGADYTLKMYYKTGELCCEGSGCNKLNKDYPNCNNSAVASDECGTEEIAPQDPYVDPCKENPNQPACCVAPQVWNGEACVDIPPCEDCSCEEYAEKHPDECKPCNDCSCPDYAAQHPDECVEKGCEDEDYFNEHLSECCPVGDGVVVKDGQCVRECSKHKAQYITHVWGDKYTNNDIYFMGGTCSGMQRMSKDLASWVPKNTPSFMCEGDFEWNDSNRSNLMERLNLTCDYQGDGHYDGTPFACFFSAQCTTDNGWDCVEGMLLCTLAEWTCDYKKSCGDTINSCK